MSVPNTTAPAVVFPDGTQIFVKDICSIKLVTDTITIGVGGIPTAFPFVFVDAATAAIAMNQIYKLVNGTTGGVLKLTNGSPLAFNSLNPPTNTVDASYSGFVDGAGFVTAGINLIKFDDGAGHVLTTSIWIVNSDINASTGFGIPTPGDYPAGVYNLSYSNDSGATWTPMGALTLTIS